MFSRILAGVILGVALTVVLIALFWREIEHYTAMTLAGVFAYKILKHRYFPKHTTGSK